MRKKKRNKRGLGFFTDVIGLDRLGPVGTAMLVAAPVTAAALFYVWTHIESVRLGYALSEAGAAHEQIVERNRALKLDVAALKAPERLERMAEKYGLQAPRPEQIIRIDDDRGAGARP